MRWSAKGVWLVVLLTAVRCATSPLRSVPVVPPVPTVISTVGANSTVPFGATTDRCVVVHTSKRAYSILGLIAWGDASIQTARLFEPSGFRLSRVASVDVHCKYVFGIGYCETSVCGLFR